MPLEFVIDHMRVSFPSNQCVGKLSVPYSLPLDETTTICSLLKMECQPHPKNIYVNVLSYVIGLHGFLSPLPLMKNIIQECIFHIE
jgi:hypothetical protein